jgi:hypothetical protein
VTWNASARPIGWGGRCQLILGQHLLSYRWREVRTRRIPGADVARRHAAVMTALPALAGEGHAAVVLRHGRPALGVSSGPCGAAALAGLRAVLTGMGSEERRAALRLDATSVVVLLSTEGTDANPHSAADR